jgi:hypothetical protein
MLLVRGVGFGLPVRWRYRQFRVSSQPLFPFFHFFRRVFLNPEKRGTAFRFRVYDEFWVYCFSECREFKVGCANHCRLREQLWIPPFSKSYAGKQKGEIK